MYAFSHVKAVPEHTGEMCCSGGSSVPTGSGKRTFKELEYPVNLAADQGTMRLSFTGGAADPHPSQLREGLDAVMGLPPG